MVMRCREGLNWRNLECVSHAGRGAGALYQLRDGSYCMRRGKSREVVPVEPVRTGVWRNLSTGEEWAERLEPIPGWQ